MFVYGKLKTSRSNTVNKIPLEISRKYLKVNEIFYSLQGESTAAGKPCVFIRLSYCNLHCDYCDTEYAFHDGKDITIGQIIEDVTSYNCKLVEVTGGEPLLQENVHPLLKTLCDSGFSVLLETGGHVNIDTVDKRVKIIMDIKCPSSNESEKNHWLNLDILKNSDEVKFVISDKNDFDWAKSIISKYKLSKKFVILFSPVFGILNNKDLAEWILIEKLPVQMQLQMHKYIWPESKRGV